MIKTKSVNDLLKNFKKIMNFMRMRKKFLNLLNRQISKIKIKRKYQKILTKKNNFNKKGKRRYLFRIKKTRKKKAVIKENLIILINQP